MEPILTVEQMRCLDGYYIENVVDGQELMRRAGVALAEVIESSQKIVFFCGGGNNGGDGYATTFELLNRNATFEEIDMFYIKPPRSEESRFFFDNINDERVNVKDFESYNGECDYDCVVDCLLGTGFSGVPSGKVSDAINIINNLSLNRPSIKTISMDINSGINGDTGDGELFVKSDLTLSIGYKKRGFLNPEFEKACKKLENVNIGYELSKDNLSPFDGEEDILWV